MMSVNKVLSIWKREIVVFRKIAILNFWKKMVNIS